MDIELSAWLGGEALFPPMMKNPGILGHSCQSIGLCGCNEPKVVSAWRPPFFAVRSHCSLGVPARRRRQNIIALRRAKRRNMEPGSRCSGLQSVQPISLYIRVLSTKGPDFGQRPRHSFCAQAHSPYVPKKTVERYNLWRSFLACPRQKGEARTIWPRPSGTS